jgi:hypothetical protein
MAHCIVKLQAHDMDTEGKGIGMASGPNGSAGSEISNFEDKEQQGIGKLLRRVITA